jgi:uncharacterized protein YndB with AHSA1/START domain
MDRTARNEPSASGGPADQIATDVIFTEQGQRTTIRVRQAFHVLTPESEHATKGARQGWTMTLDQLAAFCEQGGPDAPPHL